jgi:Na+:H+ antiporter, NhaC family
MSEDAASGETGAEPAQETRVTPRPPSLLDAVLPIVVLIGLIALTIVLFGVAATEGPLQVALLLSAAFASLIAFKNGHTAAAVADAAIGVSRRRSGLSSSCSPSAR